VHVLAISLLAGGCVIPPSLSSNTTDAGVDSPPAILKVFSDVDLKEGAPVLFEYNAANNITVTVRDTDLGDTLYVRMFVDYNNPDQTPPRGSCLPAPSAKSPDRTSVCNIQGLCLMSDIGQTRGLSFVVFDREPQDTGTPLYQAMPPDGQSTSRFFYLKCQPAS
jgi:hypothetical protein